MDGEAVALEIILRAVAVRRVVAARLTPTRSIKLAGGRKYVGMTTDINRRLTQHFSGNGAAFTQRYPPLSVNHVQRCRSVTTARRAETIVYGNMARYHGTRVVRGAGYTRSR